MYKCYTIGNRQSLQLALSSLIEYETSKTIMSVHVEYKINMIYNEKIVLVISVSTTDPLHGCFPAFLASFSSDGYVLTLS